MTQANTPQDPIDRLADIVERFIDVSSRRMDQMEQRQDQLERAMLGQQSMMGVMSQAVLRLEERHNELIAQTQQAQAISNARMDRIEEGLERLEMLFENSLRQQRDQDD